VTGLENRKEIRNQQSILDAKRKAMKNIPKELKKNGIKTKENMIALNNMSDDQRLVAYAKMLRVEADFKAGRYKAETDKKKDLANLWKHVKSGTPLNANEKDLTANEITAALITGDDLEAKASEKVGNYWEAHGDEEKGFFSRDFRLRNNLL